MIWYSDKLEEVARELDTNLDRGLTQEQVEERLKQWGPNKLDEKPPRTFFRRFLDQMKDVMVIILIIDAHISLGLSI